MANMKVDTVRLETDGKRILELSNQYKVLINDFFDRIDGAIKNGWSGEASVSYRSSLKIDRETFMKLFTCINQYGNELIFQADFIRDVLKKWERE